MGDLDQSYVDWKQWDPDSFGRYTREEAAYFLAETSLGTTPVNGPGETVLEIGFGNGAFLGWAKSRSAFVFGVETNPILTQRACDYLGGPLAFQSLDDPALESQRGKLTLIAAFDVVEHIPFESIAAMLQRCRALLAPGGRILLRFPNGDSPFGRIVQHGDPTHVTVLGRGKIEFLARDAGLRLAALNAPSLPVWSGGVARAFKRLALKAGRSMIEPVVGLLYYGGRRIPLDPNYVATLVAAD